MTNFIREHCSPLFCSAWLLPGLLRLLRARRLRNVRWPWYPSAATPVLPSQSSEQSDLRLSDLAGHSDRLEFRRDTVRSHGNSQSLVFLSNMVFSRSHCCDRTRIDIERRKFKAGEESSTSAAREGDTQIPLSVDDERDTPMHYLIDFLFSFVPCLRCCHPSFFLFE